MKDELADIIQKAIKFEEYSYRLYMNASEKTDAESIKAVLIKLAGQEGIHKEKLQALAARNLSMKEATPKAVKVDLSEEILLTPPDELRDLIALLKFAINLEVKAQKKYWRMAKSVEDKDASALFATLAEQEKQHENVLKDAAEELGL